MTPLRAIEEWTGHRKPRNRMKTFKHAFLWFWVAIYTIWFMSSCSFSVAADGAKSFNLDGEEAAKAIKILTDK